MMINKSQKRFISAPTKLLVLIITPLLITSIGFAVITFLRSGDEYKLYQQESLKKEQEHWQLHNRLLSDQLRTWLESFNDMILNDQQYGVSDIKRNLKKQYATLQLHLNVDDLWFVDQNNKFVFSSTKAPPYIETNIKKVLKEQIPIDEVYCAEKCQQLIVIPILSVKGEDAVIAITASLVDVLFSMKQTLKSDVALIEITNHDMASTRVISSSDHQLMQNLLPLLKDKKNIDHNKQAELQHRFSFELQNKFYLLNLLPLSNNKGKKYFLALMDDATHFKQENERYLQQFLIAIVIIFVSVAIAISTIAYPFASRLLALAEALPLLAQKKFKQFRESHLQRKQLFIDELDVLAISAVELSIELEQLNLQVEQKTHELENIAMYDLLTGLPNRNMLNYQIKKELANLARSKMTLAVLYLDLDDFKKVNDCHGHEQGDSLLIEAAQRIRSCLEPSDWAFRFSGDGFVILVSQESALEAAKVIAEILVQQFLTPIKIEHNMFYISASIGIAYTDKAQLKSEELISQADMAMSNAKSEGGARYLIYHEAMHLKVLQQVMLETEVRQALDKNQFSLSLQPQVNAKTHQLFGFEALLRWQHPSLGMVSPEDFIPILEKMGYMVELGYWIIRHSFELAKRLQQEINPDICIAINLTASQFADPYLYNYLQKLLDEFDLSATNFELELTEQTLVTEMDLAIEVMNKLKILGFRFAIDDFGTGYSSLAYIKSMPIDVIKIDKSFVFGMLDNQSDYQIIKSTIAMVKNLSLVAVAEGVETSAQLRSLAELDCDLIQGYFFSKPIPETEIINFLQEKITEGYWKTKIDKVS